MHPVRRLLICGGVAGLFVCVQASQALPQDMTVYTTLSIPVAGGAAKPLCRSTTLFHAGKVYDYMEDAGELVVLEPQAGRFVIVNGNYTGTRVEFSELNQFLKVAQAETESYVAELALQNSPGTESLQNWLRFQLEPQFKESPAGAGRLTLDSPLMRYDVEEAAPPEPGRVEQYLAYADMAAQLNFVLHPGSTFPAPRLKLNEMLRRHAALPVSVKLVSNSDKPVTLQANHKFQWELQSADKQHIHQWERLLESEQVRWVGFHEYQERLLADTARRAK